ncbi:MAG: DUF2914 domain-containing protein [Candidatus Latescibacterota bacterium]
MVTVKAEVIALLIGMLCGFGCGEDKKQEPAPKTDRGAVEESAHPQTLSETTPQKIVVCDLKICEEIRSRTPIRVGSRFPKTVRALYCFSDIRGAEKSTTISHLWYYKGKMMADVTLPIDYKRIRTWSSKNLQSDWTGEWTVYVVSAHGNVLASTQFTLE